MKKIFVFSLVIIIAAMSVIAVSAAPRGGYYDQIGNKYWCNSDSYGCWVTGEDGGHEYIMFWSEAAATAIMGPNSGAPVGTLPGTSTLNLAAPVAEAAAAAEKKEDKGGEKPECTEDKDCTDGKKCENNKCVAKSDGGDPTPTNCTTTGCATGEKCNTETGLCEQETQKTCDDNDRANCVAKKDQDEEQCTFDESNCRCSC